MVNMVGMALHLILEEGDVSLKRLEHDAGHADHANAVGSDTMK